MRIRFKNGREREDIVDIVRTADGVLPWTNKGNYLSDYLSNYLSKVLNVLPWIKKANIFKQALEVLIGSY